MRKQEQQIAEWLTKVKFKKKAFGGVDEMDVWKKIEELHSLYEQALAAQRVHYETLLSQAEKRPPNELRKSKVIPRKKAEHE